MKKLTLLFALVFFLSSVQEVLAIDKFWRPIVSQDFNEILNWIPVGIPGAGDQVHFDQFDLSQCFITSDISVQGIILDTNYTGIVWINNGVDVTLGVNGFEQHDGTFQCADGDVWCNGDFDMFGGVFSTPLGTLGFGKNLYLQPTFPGFFNDNGGWIEFFGSSACTLTQLHNFFNIRINKTFSAAINIPSGMWLSATQELILDNGYVQGLGELRSGGVTTVNASMLSGSAPFVLNGANGQICNMEHANWSQQKIVVRMQDFSSQVWMRSTLSNLELLANNDTLHVELGRLFLDHPSSIIQAKHTIIDPPGTFSASFGDTYLDQNWENNGTFEHNNGNFHFSSSYASNFNTTSEETFFNLEMEKTFSTAVTVDGTDQLKVLNKYTSSTGYLHGLDALLMVEDTAWFKSTHVKGNIPISFSGSPEGNFIYDGSQVLFDDMRIAKDNPLTRVYFETNNAFLELGDYTNETVTIEQGTLAFQNCGDYVNWDIENLIIETPGNFIAWPGDTRFSGHFTNNGGGFFHNNGNWMFDESYGRSFDGNSITDFYNLEMNKAFSTALTVAGTDTIRAMNKYTSTTGYLHGTSARLAVADTAWFKSTHLKGNIPVSFTGNAEGNFIYDGSQVIFNEMRIDKTDPSTIVYFETNNGFLELGDFTNETVTIDRGTLAFQNCGSHVNWDVENLIIESEGTYIAWEGDTRFSGHFTNNGGTFAHNNGNWMFDESYGRSFDGNSITDFYNLEMNKPSSTAITVAGTDTVRAMNKYTSTTGYLHGTSARLAVADTAWFKSTHLKGNIPVSFTGSVEGNFIYDGSQVIFNEMRIDKTDPSTIVYFETNNGFLELGDFTNETVTIDRGTLAFQNCGSHVNWDVQNLIIESEGTYIAWEGDTRFSGHFTNNGGTFAHNNGNWMFDESYPRSFDGNSITDFYNLEMNKPSSTAITVAGTDTVRAMNKYTSTTGYLHGTTARLAVADTAWFKSTHLKGNIPVSFTGSAEGNFIYDGSQVIFNEMRIDKTDPSTIVYFETNNGFLELGDFTNETVTIDRGTLAFQNCGSHLNWDVENLIIELEGTFIAWEGDTRFSGHFINNGGVFEHNGGHWKFDESYPRSFNGNDRTEFFNLTVDKPFSTALTVLETDTIQANNRYNSMTGYMHGSGALSILDTAFISTTHLAGTIDLEFIGNETSNFIIDHTSGTCYPEVYVRKDPGSTVFLETTTTSLDAGLNGQTFILSSGEAQFQNCGTHVDWNFSDTRLEDGQFTAWNGTTNWLQDLETISGQFDGNGGTMNVTGSYAKTFDLGTPPEFWNLDVTNTFSSALNLTSGHANVNGLLNFDTGYMNSGEIHALGDVLVQPSFIGGSTTLEFSGNGIQVFDLTGAEDNYEGIIRLNKPSGQVELISDLIIEDNFAQLDFTMGHLGYNTTERVIFANGVGTGWVNANNDSYIDGPAVKVGTSQLTLPIGDGGWFAPLAFSAFPVFNDQFTAEYFHASPAANGYPQNMDATLDHVSSCEYWVIQRDNGTYQPQLTLSYDAVRCGAINAPVDLRVSEWNGALWEDRGQSADSGTSITSLNTFNSFGVVTLGSINSNNPMDTTGSQGCPEDFNGDGLVNTADLLTLLSEFGCSSGCTTDLDGDGAVTTSDLLAFLSAYGNIC